MTANKTRKPIVKHDEEMSRDGISKLEELILQFLEYLEIEKGASKYTIRNYHLYLRRFSDWFFNEEKSRDIRKLDLNHVRKFRLFLSRYSYGKGRTLEKVTQSYYVIALRSFLKWLTKRDYEVISAENIDLPKTESRRIEFLTRSQVERLLTQPRISNKNGLRDKAILETLFSTGLRVSELINLNREHIDLERREFGVRGKGGRSRVVFLSKRAAGWIERYLSIREDKWLPLFIRYSGKKDDPNSKGVDMRLSVRSVQRMVVHYCKQAKLPIQITPHGLRHSFATDLLHSGAGLREVQEMLGHKNVSTTQIYTHVTNPQLRKVHDRYHSGNR